MATRSAIFPRLLRLLAPIAVLLIAAWIGTSHAAAPQGAVKSVHGEWQVRCDSRLAVQFLFALEITCWLRHVAF